MNKTTFQTPIIATASPRPKNSPGKSLNRLIAAAVINQNFCETLLNDPLKAIESGFGGEDFCLNKHEKSMLLSIQAKNLSDFAMQLVKLQHGKTRKQRAPGGGYWIPENSSMVTMETK
jgi:hypothetical protein